MKLAIDARVVLYAPGNAPAPDGAVVHIWPGGEPKGRPQAFTAGKAGRIRGSLEIPGNQAKSKAGKRLFYIRVLVKDKPYAAARDELPWRNGRIGQTIYIGYLVQGSVKNKDGSIPRPSAQKRVEIYSTEAGKQPRRLGMSQPVSARGLYWAKYRPLIGADAKLAVEARYIMPARGGLDAQTKAKSPPFKNPFPEETVNLIVGQRAEEKEKPKPKEKPEKPKPKEKPEKPKPKPEKPKEEPPAFVIRGKVAAQNKPAIGKAFRLVVLRTGLKKEETVFSGQVTLGDDYEVTFKPGKRLASIRVEAHLVGERNAKRSLLFRSKKISRPESPLTLDLELGDPINNLPLFERLMTRIEPHLDDLQVYDLTPEQWSEITATAGLETVDQQRLQEALKLVRQTEKFLTEDDPRKFFPTYFVLTGNGERPGLAQLVAAPKTKQLKQLQTAVKTNIIGKPPWKIKIDDAEVSVSFADFLNAKILHLRTRVLLDSSKDNDYLPGRIAMLGVKSKTKLSHVLNLAAGAEDSHRGFIKKVMESPNLTGPEKQRIKTVFEAAEVADFNMPLVAALTSDKAKHKLDRPEKIAAYTAKELAALIKKSGVPTQFENDAEPEKAYAEALLDKTHARYPTGAFAAKLSVTKTANKDLKGIADLLSKNTNFNLFTQPVSDHFRLQSEKTDDRPVLSKAKFGALQKIQRTANLAPQRQAAMAVAGLQKLEIGSAREITKLGRQRFNAVATQHLGPGLVAQIYSAAVAIMNYTGFLATQYITGVSHGPRLPVYIQPTFDFDSPDLTTLEDLFGSFDYCACEHCRSVYSAAAYLADLLHWLGREFVCTDGTSAYDKLMERRPDIANLELSCENTNTLLPHIDLVLELLEYVVTIGTNNLNNSDNQTTWQTPDLLRDGEHFGPEEIPAYGRGRLFDAIYPWTLPFNLWLEQCRAYLKEMGAERHGLLELTQKLKPWDATKESAIEILGMNEIQFNIISGQHSGTMPSFWNGTNPGNASVETILKLSGLSFDELLEVLKTEYVSGGLRAGRRFEIIFQPDKPCDLSSARIRPAINRNAGSRFHRLVRLQKTLGWSFWELDEALLRLKATIATATTTTATSATTTTAAVTTATAARRARLIRPPRTGRDDPLDEGFLLNLAQFIKVQKRTGLGVAELLAWFGKLPAYQGEVASEFYKANFLEKAGPGQPTAIFELKPAANPRQRELLNPKLPSNSQPYPVTPEDRTLILETLGYNADDFSPAISTRILNLRSLTFLYRYKSVATAAGFSVTELFQLLSLIPVNVNNWRPVDATYFFEFLDWFKAQNLSVEELTFLLNGADPAGVFSLASEKIEGLKDALYGLEGAYHEILSNQLPQDNNGDIDFTEIEAKKDEWGKRINESFKWVLDSFNPTSVAEIFSAVVEGRDSELPQFSLLNPTQPFDKTEFINYVTGNATLEFDMAAAVAEPDYPRDPDDNVSTEKTALEVKAVFLKFVQPQMIEEKLKHAFLEAFSNAFEIPLPRAEDLLNSTQFSGLGGSNTTFVDMFVPAADPNYDPASPIASPSNLDDNLQKLYLFIQRLQALDLLEETPQTLTLLRLNPSPGVSSSVTGGAWFNVFNLGLASTPAALKVAGRKWQNLTQGLGLQKALGRPLGDIISNLGAALANANPAQTLVANLSDPESRISRFGEEAIKAVIEHLIGGQTQNLNLPAVIRDTASILGFLEKAEITLQQAIDYAAYPDGPSLPAAIRNSLRNHFEEKEDWDKTIQEIHDPLREIRAARITEYLIARSNVEDTADLYSHFLIDVEMSSCMKTSRLVQANSAAQLFVQRIFLGLEADICFSEEQKKEWEWRKNYRVWEAARKVFLYPENWLEESLRLDKTPFFKELEDDLLQGELSDERIEKAYVDYLTKVAEVSRLDIQGLCYDAPFDPIGYVRYYGGDIHIFGRTRSIPHQYFYRRQKTSGAWTPWEKVDLDIESDHLMPVIWNRKLNLLWPSFVEKRKERKNPDVEIKYNDRYQEIRINRSFLQNGKWATKIVSKKAVLAGKYSGVGVFNNLDRKTGIVGNKIESLGGLGLIAKKETTTQETHLHHAIYSHTHDNTTSVVKYYDFSHVSNKQKQFFFMAHPDPLQPNDLRIRIRRGFHESMQEWIGGYLEVAYEDGFRISGCDGFTVLEPDYMLPDPIPETPPLPSWRKYNHYRPPFTLPDAMKLRNGFETEAQKIAEPDAARKLYTKYDGRLTEVKSDRWVLFNETPPGFELIFAQQNQDHFYFHPFFFEDKKHTYFADPKVLRIPTFWPNVFTTGGYKFINLTIPGTCLYLSELNTKGVEGLLAPQNTTGQPADGLRRQQIVFDDQFATRYAPTFRVHPDYPVEDMDFTWGSPTAIYFWEIFFHIPMLMAEHLQANGKFAEALKWVSYIFDPTNQDPDEIIESSRFWMLKPFYEYQTQGPIQTMMQTLSLAETSDEFATKQALTAQIVEWQKDPFDPHAVASMRTSSYMLWTFCTYVEILIDWGDSLFRQDTRESINEAIQLYILAGQLLGRKPDEVEHKDPPIKTFNDLKNDLDAFSNAPVEVENRLIAYDFANGPPPSGGIGDGGQMRALYFCVPNNPKLLELWDTIADRLFKIRHCMNIEGVVRELALFQPPIDPGLLVRARAAGLDISQVLADLSAPRPHYRFNYLIQKANEFTAEVKSFGAALLSASEKRDSEQMAQLRSRHEIAIQNAMRNVRKQQIEEAKTQVEALQQTMKLTETRKANYENREKESKQEKKARDLSNVAEGFQYAEQIAMLTAAPLTVIPDAYVGYVFAKLTGGEKISQAVITGAKAAGAAAALMRLRASTIQTKAGYERRQEEWDLQIDLAKEEIKKIEKDIIGAEIRLAMAEQEKANLELQIDQSREVLEFMKSKFSNEKLYSWMSRELSKLHYQAYTLAYDLSKVAEKAYANELSRDDGPYVKFGNWDGQKQGLLAGETLGLQLKQLEAAYMENNKREYELNRSISLKLLDAGALLNLINTGKCEFEVPGWLFDLDFPGLYMRRIKTLALSIPCVTGPQVPIHCKLTLLRYEIQREPETSTPPEVYFDAIQSVITSSGLNDTGLFETNLQDARYLPFEGCGAIARFRLELPEKTAFDKTTISDAVLTLNYTARDGGDVYRADKASTVAGEISTPGLLMSLRHDFQQEWQAFLDNGTTLAADAINNTGPTLSPPAILDEQIPYLARLAGETYSTTPKAYALVNKDGAFEFQEFTSFVFDLSPPTGDGPYFTTDKLYWYDQIDSHEIIDIFLFYPTS